MRRATERQRWVSPRFRSHRYVKRIYAALMISSLVCQLQVIVVSTVALERLSRAYDKEVSVESFMRRYFDLEWIAVRLNFFVGVLSFVTAIGLRAWQTVRRAASFPPTRRAFQTRRRPRSSRGPSAPQRARTRPPRRRRRAVPLLRPPRNDPGEPFYARARPPSAGCA